MFEPDQVMVIVLFKGEYMSLFIDEIKLNEANKIHWWFLAIRK